MALCVSSSSSWKPLLVLLLLLLPLAIVLLFVVHFVMFLSRFVPSVERLWLSILPILAWSSICVSSSAPMRNAEQAAAIVWCVWYDCGAPNYLIRWKIRWKSPLPNKKKRPDALTSFHHSVLTVFCSFILHTFKQHSNRIVRLLIRCLWTVHLNTSCWPSGVWFLYTQTQTHTYMHTYIYTYIYK